MSVEFDTKYRDRFSKLSTTNVSDAMDALGMRGYTYGIRPMIERWNKVIGPAVTVKMTAAGPVKSKHHLGMKAIAAALPGDVIVIDNGGKPDISCWGGILANSAKIKGVSGTVIDGACRDLDDCIEIDYPVFARGTVVATARGRAMEESTNTMIQFGGVQVSPGDIVIGDSSGVVIVPYSVVDDVLNKAEELFEKEEAMIAEIRLGGNVLEIDSKFNYEKMLKK
jgi:regulator of RNase E activity RraA